jgi:hypothetical protein
MASDTVEEATGGEGRGITAETEPEGTWSAINAAVITLFVLLTVLGIMLSLGFIESIVEVGQNGSPKTVTVPGYVYLYAGLGSLGYVFTKLMVEFDRYDEWSDAEALASMLMRVPAALILAAGVFLLLGGAPGSGGTNGGSGTGSAQFVAGVAFLVGLYVNVALKSLGSLADRILGRSPRGSDSESGTNSESSRR